MARAVQLSMTGHASGADPRVARFLSEIEALTPDAWVAIGERYLVARYAIRVAVEEADDVGVEIAMNRAPVPDGRTKEEWMKAIKQANARAAAVTATLPATVKRDGNDFPLRDAARMATWSAMRALLVYDDLLSRKGGDQVARTLLAPFEGVVSPV